MKLYHTGYKSNDVYADYLAMDRPSWLSREAVRELKEHNSGTAVKTEILYLDGEYETVIKIRENDVYLLELLRL